MADTIFINYRREDSTGAAGRLHDRLVQAFGQKNLFMDVDHIPPGVDFVAHLNSLVASCDIILVVIGPHWLDAKDETGQRRLLDPQDFVAIEIAAALTRNIRVIPILVDGARMPKASELPDSLKHLARRQAVEVRHSQFGRDAEALIKKIQPSRTWRPWMLLAAAPVGALVIYGWIVLYELGMPGWMSAPVSVPREASAQQEEERKAKAASEAETKRKAEQADQQRLAALKADEERKARADAEAETKRKAEQAEQQRLAALKADEERKARADAEAETKRKAEQAEQQRLAALKADEERKAKVPAQTRGWLGVKLQVVTDEIAESLGIKPARGALIAGVDDKGPAKPAGIELGDVVVIFDGKNIQDMRDLPRIVADTPVGKYVAVVIIRKGKEETKTVRLGRLDDSDKSAPAPAPVWPEPKTTMTPEEKSVVQRTLGLELSDMSEELRQRYQIKDSIKGVVITNIDASSVGAAKRIVVGSVLVAIEQEQITNAADVRSRLEVLKKAGKKTALLLMSNAGGDMLFVPLPLN